MPSVPMRGSRRTYGGHARGTLAVGVIIVRKRLRSSFGIVIVLIEPAAQHAPAYERDVDAGDEQRKVCKEIEDIRHRASIAPGHGARWLQLHSHLASARPLTVGFENDGFGRSTATARDVRRPACSRPVGCAMTDASWVTHEPRPGSPPPVSAFGKRPWAWRASSRHLVRRCAGCLLGTLVDEAWRCRHPPFRGDRRQAVSYAAESPLRTA
jgi:hypothetical protein